MTKLLQVPQFPTRAEIIREVISALGTKQSSDAKALDDYVKTGESNYQQFSEVLDKFIFDPIRSMTCDNTAQFLKKEIDRFFKDYLGLVKLVALDRLSREKAFPLIIEHYFSVRAARFLSKFQEHSDGLSPIHFVDSDKTAIDAVFSWIDENEPGWNKSCTKEEKDKFVSWRKGKHLPNLTSFNLIPLSPENKTLLLIARAFDYFRDTDFGKKGVDLTRRHLLLDWWNYDHGEPLSLAQIEANNNFPLFMEAIKSCKHLLLGSSDCSSILKEHAYEQIENLKAAFKKEDPNGQMQYLINWCEARWYVKAGNIKEAVKSYKLAFDQCLYSAGKAQEIIYKDALKVAAKAKDLAFLKQLKNYGIIFGFFIAPPEKDKLDAEVNNKRNRSRSNLVEDWETDRWINEFHREFPKQTLFKKTNPYKKEIKQTHLLLVDGLIKPDFSKPNRIVKVDRKRMPQLVYFILSNGLQENNIAIIKQLLEKGAKVNIASETGDTPILLAIQNMDVFEPTASLDDTCYKLITSHSHTKDTVNKRTSKLKLLPLICAVNTGKVEVVNKLLEFGAEIDRRGDVEQHTALYICINRVQILKNPNLFETILKNGFNNTPVEQLEDLRRRNGYQLGNTHDEIESKLDNAKDNPIFSITSDVVVNIVKERLAKLDIDSFREIAYLLIQKGANPNIEMNSPVKGYTPLMLAAESDEAELFEEMLRYGGKPDKYYNHPKTGQKINCFKIAIAFKSHKVTEILKNKYGYGH